MAGWHEAGTVAPWGTVGGKLDATYVSSDGRARWMLFHQETAIGRRPVLYLEVDGKLAAEVMPYVRSRGHAANVSTVAASRSYYNPHPGSPAHAVIEGMDVVGERVPNADVRRAFHPPRELMNRYVWELQEGWRAAHAQLTSKRVAAVAREQSGSSRKELARQARAYGGGGRVSDQGDLSMKVARGLTHIPAHRAVYHGWVREEPRGRPEHRLFAVALLLGLAALGLGLGGVSGGAATGQIVAGAGGAAIGGLVGVALAVAALVSRWQIHGRRGARGKR